MCEWAGLTESNDLISSDRDAAFVLVSDSHVDASELVIGEEEVNKRCS